MMNNILTFLANIYLFKVNNRNNRKSYAILVFLLFTLKYFTPFSSVSIVNFEQGNVSLAAYEAYKVNSTGLISSIHYFGPL